MLLRDIDYHRVVHRSTNNSAISFNQDVMLVAVFDNRLLLTEWVDLRHYQYRSLVR